MAPTPEVEKAIVVLSSATTKPEVRLRDRARAVGVSLLPIDSTSRLPNYPNESAIKPLKVKKFSCEPLNLLILVVHSLHLFMVLGNACICLIFVVVEYGGRSTLEILKPLLPKKPT